MTFLMTVLVSALAFFLLLSVLIIIHECGHFFMARWNKVEVEEFGFGLPPRATTLFYQGKTRFSLNWIPFGGFVRLKGENAMDAEERKQKGSFAAASIPSRILILIAGVSMNFILAITLLIYGFSYGQWMPTYSSLEDLQAAADRGEIMLDLGVYIQEVTPSSGAQRAGVPPQSLLVKVDDTSISLPSEIQPLQEGKWRVRYTVLSGKDFSIEQTFTVLLDEGKAGVTLVPYPRQIEIPERSLFESTRLAFRESWVMTVHTVIGLGNLFFSLAQTGTVPEGITGIVGIAQMTHLSVQAGLMTYLRLVALLSLSLAILNILPFPALDGGRLLFVLVEFIGRRPINRQFEVATNAIGFAVLLLLIIVITFHDILSLF